MKRSKKPVVVSAIVARRKRKGGDGLCGETKACSDDGKRTSAFSAQDGGATKRRGNEVKLGGKKAEA